MTSSSSSRPFRQLSIDKLEEAVRRAWEDHELLAVLHAELELRSTRRSEELRDNVAERLGSLRGGTSPRTMDSMPADSATDKEDDDLAREMDGEAAASLPGQDEPEEPIEGLGDAEDKGWGDYPIDTLLIRHESRTVLDVVRRMDQGSFVMDPDFQRDFIWPVDKQSKLIESVLMRIPLPVFYLAEDDHGRMVVVDGLQRLSTFQRFFRNELRLRLPDQDTLDKKRFQDLSAKLQNRVEDCNLILYIIDAKVPERARLDIFERVNGGVPLTRQQMRNCLYMGDATRFLKTEAATDIFQLATGQSLKTSTMRDREFVNRFCAFQLQPLQEYKGDMDEFLALVLKKMNRFERAELNRIGSELHAALENNYSVFGKHAFRKHLSQQSGRGVVNASLWDVMSTGLSRYSQTTVAQRAEPLRQAFYTLMKNDAFIRSITYSPNSTAQVKQRFDTVGRMLGEVFGATKA